MSALAADSDELGLLDVARLAVDALEAAKVEYMLGGALAVAAYAQGRTTQDADLVINVPVESIDGLAAELKRRHILTEPDVILDTFLETRGDLALVAYHLHTTQKIEFFLLRPGDALRAAALARRRLVDLGEPLGQVYVHSAEDLILYKLKYWDLSSQAKHVRDITLILIAQAGRLDMTYLTEWVTRLGLQVAWRYMQAETAREQPGAQGRRAAKAQPKRRPRR